MSTTFTKSTGEKDNRTALTNVGEEPEGRGGVEQETEQVDTADDMREYPKTFRLAMVILALVLAVFLVALDLVSLQTRHLVIPC